MIPVEDAGQSPWYRQFYMRIHQWRMQHSIQSGAPLTQRFASLSDALETCVWEFGVVADLLLEIQDKWRLDRVIPLLASRGMTDSEVQELVTRWAERQKARAQVPRDIIRSLDETKVMLDLLHIKAVVVTDSATHLLSVVVAKREVGTLEEFVKIMEKGGGRFGLLDQFYRENTDRILWLVAVVRYYRNQVAAHHRPGFQRISMVSGGGKEPTIFIASDKSGTGAMKHEADQVVEIIQSTINGWGPGRQDTPGIAFEVSQILHQLPSGVRDRARKFIDHAGVQSSSRSDIILRLGGFVEAVLCETVKTLTH